MNKREVLLALLIDKNIKYEELPEKFKNDKEILLSVIGNGDIAAYWHAPEYLRNDQEVILQEFFVYPSVIKSIPQELLDINLAGAILNKAKERANQMLDRKGFSTDICTERAEEYMVNIAKMLTNRLVAIGKMTPQQAEKICNKNKTQAFIDSFKI